MTSGLARAAVVVGRAHAAAAGNANGDAVVAAGHEDRIRAGRAIVDGDHGNHVVAIDQEIETAEDIAILRWAAGRAHPTAVQHRHAQRLGVADAQRVEPIGARERGVAENLDVGDLGRQPQGIAIDARADHGGMPARGRCRDAVQREGLARELAVELVWSIAAAVERLNLADHDPRANCRWRMGAVHQRGPSDVVEQAAPGAAATRDGDEHEDEMPNGPHKSEALVTRVGQEPRLFHY